MRTRRTRVLRDRSLQCVDRLVEIACSEERRTESNVSRREPVRPAVDGGAVRGRRRLEIARGFERLTEVQMGLWKHGLIGDRGTKLSTASVVRPRLSRARPSSRRASG